MVEHTTLKKCWYQYYSGKKLTRKHLVMKLVCTKCRYVWDTQAFTFSYCPGCGRYVAEIEGNKENV